MNELDLSIVIPAYNEEKRISESLQKINSFLGDKTISYEILLVDDGSKDRTKEVASRFNQVKVISYDANKGKGYATRTGIKNAKGKYILTSDADLSTPIEEIEKFLDLANKHKNTILIGSRKIEDAKVNQPFLRRIVGNTFNRLVKNLVISEINDTQCGFKLYEKEIANKIFDKQILDRFAFDVEILYLSKKFGYNIKEVPVIWVNAKGSKVNVFKDSYLMLKDILKIKKYEKDGKYG